MKSVAELANELNVTPQAIYKRLNGSLKVRLKNHTQRKNGKTVIDSEGQAIIKNSFETKIKKDSKQVENVNTILVEQLQKKDEQIQQLMNQNENLLEKIENMQVLLRHEQEKNMILIEQQTHDDTKIFTDISEVENKQSKSWWEKLIGK